jgi:hypothetical protein
MLSGEAVPAVLTSCSIASRDGESSMQHSDVLLLLLRRAHVILE